MCFQGFAHCSCGHTRLFETPCKLAEDIPFYIKVACPDYQIQVVESNNPCGTGKFYCLETKEGQFFEQVHQVAERCKAALVPIDARSRSLEAQAARFNKAADDAQVSQQARQSHHAYNTIYGTLRALAQRRAQISSPQDIALKVIQEGKNYFRARGEQSRRGNSGVIPPFALSTSLQVKLPIDLQVQAAALRAPDIFISSDGNITESEILAQQQPGNPEGDNRHVTPRKSDYCPHSQQNISGLATNQFQSGFPQTFESTGRTSTSKTNSRPRRAVNIEHQEATSTIARKPGTTHKPSEDVGSSTVRRSARVRGKKVSYAESETSTVESREASPGKSDLDNFSPQKSDVSTSPEQNAIRRRPKVTELKQHLSVPGNSKPRPTHSSLGGYIDEWNRTTSTAHNAIPCNQQPRFYGMDMSFPSSGHMATVDSQCADNMAPSLAQLIGRAQNGATLAEPVANKPLGWSTSTWHEHLPGDHRISYNSAPGYGATTQSFSHDRNYLPSTPGPVPLPAYGYGNYNGNGNRLDISNPPYQSVQYHLPPGPTNANRDWLINTPAFEPQPDLTAAQGSNQIKVNMPLARYDSVVGIAADIRPTATAKRPPTHSNYERLRRSFSAAAELTPPASKDLASTNTDPRKRNLPASSPSLSNKRTRLAYSDEYTTPVLSRGESNEASGSLSSLSQMKTDERFAQGEGLPKLPNILAEDPRATPARDLAPTATMYTPHQYYERESDSANLEIAFTSSQHNEESGAIADGDTQLCPDIDWGLLNEDLF